MEDGAAAVKVTQESVSKFLHGAEGADLWELLLLNGSLDYAADAAIGTQEPAFVANICVSIGASIQ